MLALMLNHHNVVSLLKNKYGQQEPTAEEMVSYCYAMYTNYIIFFMYVNIPDKVFILLHYIAI